MATITGSFSSNSNNMQPYIVYTYTQSISNNTTTIDATLYVKKLTSYATTHSSSVPTSISIGGSIVSSGNVSIDMRSVSVGSSVKVRTASKTLNNNSDGSLKATISGIVDLSGFNPGKGTVSQSITFPTIPRATAPTISGTGKFGNAITINHNGASDSFKHTITYTIGNSSDTIVSKTDTSSTSWAIPKSLQSEIPRSSTGTITITCITYNGTKEIGRKTVNFNATVADDCIPSITSVSFTDAMTKPSTLTGYYQNFSKVKSTIAATGIYGSTITTYKVKVGTMNELNSSNNVIVGGLLANSGAYSIVVTVVDSRGKTVSKTYSNAISVTPYTPPVITSFSCKRMKLEDGVEFESNLGTIGYISGSGTIQSNMPTKIRELKFKPTSSTAWTTIPLSNQNYTNYKFSTALSPSNSYDLKLVLRDDLSSIDKDIVMSNVFPLINMNGSGNGLAFGKESTVENLIEFAMPVKMNNPLTVATINNTTLNTTNIETSSIKVTNINNTSSITVNTPVLNCTQSISANEFKSSQDAVLRGATYSAVDGEGSRVYLCCNGATPSDDEDTLGAKTIVFFKNSSGDYVFRSRSKNGSVFNGTSTYYWKQVAAAEFKNTSDRTLKENIKYVSNARVLPSDTIKAEDLYKFIKDDLPVAIYNYIDDGNLKIGFVAQDIIYNIDESDNIVGQLIVNPRGYTDDDSKLTYDLNNYVSVIVGALQVSIKKVEVLEAKVQMLEGIINGN